MHITRADVAMPKVEPLTASLVLLPLAEALADSEEEPVEFELEVELE